MPQAKFFGSDLSFLDCEVRSAARIARQLSEQESGLMNVKWFDYRMMHPVIATYYYAQCYQDAVKLMYARTRDIDEAEEIKAFSPEDIFNCVELIGFWRARQALDQLGVRYQFALRFAMNKYQDRGWRFFPRPNQMLGEELLLDVRDAWMIECKARLQTAEDPFFAAAQFVGHPAQVAYQTWLVKQVQSRPNPEFSMGTLLSWKQLHPRLAEKVFPAKIVNEARSIAAKLG